MRTALLYHRESNNKKQVGPACRAGRETAAGRSGGRPCLHRSHQGRGSLDRGAGERGRRRRSGGEARGCAPIDTHHCGASGSVRPNDELHRHLAGLAPGRAAMRCRAVGQRPLGAQRPGQLKPCSQPGSPGTLPPAHRRPVGDDAQQPQRCHQPKEVGHQHVGRRLHTRTRCTKGTPAQRVPDVTGRAKKPKRGSLGQETARARDVVGQVGRCARPRRWNTPRVRAPTLLNRGRIDAPLVFHEPCRALACTLKTSNASTGFQVCEPLAMNGFTVAVLSVLATSRPMVACSASSVAPPPSTHITTPCAQAGGPEVWVDRLSACRQPARGASPEALGRGQRLPGMMGQPVLSRPPSPSRAC